MDYKDVCGGEEIWFTLSDMKEEGRRFLQWAKELGCVWMNGKEIDPEQGTDFFTLAMRPDGKIANVPAMARVAKQFKGVKREIFADYMKKPGKS